MIISRTPLRISFVGGGSDLPSYYRHAPGAVVSTAIDKYIYITVNKKFDRHIRASYSITEIVDRREKLKHELIRYALIKTRIRGQIEITSISDIPSEGTGLGSSSTYTVGLLNALYAYKGKHVAAEQLAAAACAIELNKCKKPIGKQDQYIAAYGGLQFMEFRSDGRVFVDPVICKPGTKRKLKQHLLLLYTGKTRAADRILGQQEKRSRSKATRSVLAEMVKLAHVMRRSLQKNDLSSFGHLLHANWELKKKLARGISSRVIDQWYAIARKKGAMGGKIVGAGGGGFLLLYAPKERHRAIIRALPKLEVTPFSFEPQGSKIIYVG